MASVVTIGTLLLFGVVFVVLILVVLLGAKSRKDANTLVKRELDRAGKNKYTEKEIVDAAKTVNPDKYRNTDVKRADVFDLATAVEFVSHEMYVQSRANTRAVRSGAWVALSVFLLVALCAGLLYIIFTKPELVYYGYLIGAVACLVLLMMINPNVGGSRVGGVNLLYALICILFLGGAVVLAYFGIREILIFDAASGGTGDVSPSGYKVYDINSDNPQIKYW